jgi:hypothetical protein
VIVQGDSVGFDLVDRAVESTKTTLGLKLFLSLAWHGERGPGDYVASRYDLTRRFRRTTRLRTKARRFGREDRG